MVEIDTAYVALEPGGHQCDAQTACDLTVPDGTAVSLTAEDYYGIVSDHNFQRWAGDACTLEDATCSIVVKADTETTAFYHYRIFAPPD